MTSQTNAFPRAHPLHRWRSSPIVSRPVTHIVSRPVIPARLAPCPAAPTNNPLSGGDDDGDGERVDIDSLAARLGAEAERMRQAQDGSNTSEFTGDDSSDAAASLPPAEPPSASASADALGPLGSYESARGEADILASVGDGELFASDFELLQELGQIAIQQVEAPAQGSLTGSAVATSSAAVIAYAATYYSGMPFQDPVPTLLKEYLPGARAVACNELQVLHHLVGMPTLDLKWRRAAAPLSQDPPVVELLGYFLAGSSERALAADPSIAAAPPADSIWIVQRWDGMAPLALYPASQQTSGIGLGRLFGGEDAGVKQRKRMIRAIAHGALRAVAFCHQRGVVHGALGSGSFLLSTFDDSSAVRLVVKLDNFGFARLVQTAPPPRQSPASSSRPFADDDTPLALGQRGDLRQLAVVLLECTLSALGSDGPSDRTSGEAVQRVLGEVFSWDLQQFRHYCSDDPDLAGVVALLEDNDAAGWALLHALVGGTNSAAELLEQSGFCLR